MPRYRFAEFVLSPRRRILLREGREQPLIPRYFDLLVFLVERRHEAVHRRDIFDRVWNDVIVSDSALSQAIRTIRRTLGDDPREPRFIRTVSRHGYRFVADDVVEEEEDEGATTGDSPALDPPASELTVAAPALPPLDVDPFEPLLDRITREPASADQEDQREAAELLHALGTAEALQRLGTRQGHAFGRALLRDTRWDVAQAGDVPLMGQPATVDAARALVRLRLGRAARVASARLAGAVVGGGLAGLVAGGLGGLLLVLVPGSSAPAAVVAVLSLIGAGCGAVGAAGVGAGLSVAEAVARSRRTLALFLGGALGGGGVGLVTQWLARWTLAALVGVYVEIGGGLEGLLIGGGAGLGYGWATTRGDGGLAAPRGGRRVRVAAWTALGCGAAALMLTAAGRPLAGGSIHAIAQASRGSQAMLTPLGWLVGESDFGPISGVIIGTGEGILFGLGLAAGLTRRP